MRTDLAAVLFDLDGTLVDSAPDLAGAANDMRLARGLPAMAYGDLRPVAGAGARGMLGASFGIGPSDSAFEAMKLEFLDRYADRLLQCSAVFDHIVGLMDVLRARRLPWGIVTNKAARFTQPLVSGLPALAGAAVVISGDTTPYTKPHPAPLLAASQQLGLAPATVVYVGDDLRDMQAAKAAGMKGVAAAWGYLGSQARLQSWPAEAICKDANELLKWLRLA